MFDWMRRAKKPYRLYLDYAAATPVHSEVLAAMQPYFAEQFGNASAIHAEGAAAKQAVDGARLAVARTLGIRAPEVIFTASGSESNNLAIYGCLRHLVEVEQVDWSAIEIIATKLEHPSIIEVLNHLVSHGVTVHYVPVDAVGKIDLTELSGLLNEKTRLVTFAYANSEIGVVQDVKRITRLVKKYNTEQGTTIKVHLDAAQAPLWLPCQMPQLGVDLLSLDAGKCQGPKGVGMLAVRNVELQGITLGGGQEMGLRAGTENTAGVVGAAKALELAQEPIEGEYAYDHRNDEVHTEAAVLLQELQARLPEMQLNGPEFALTEVVGGHQVSRDRLPNNINISLPGIDTEFAVVVLDKHGIAASTKSACSGAGSGESAVVKTISGDAARAAATIRFSLGPDSQMQWGNAKLIANVLRDHIDQMQSFDSISN